MMNRLINRRLLVAGSYLALLTGLMLTRGFANPPTTGKIAFAAPVANKYQIFVMNEDGTNRINLTNSENYDYFPSWSPDGTKIAYWSVLPTDLSGYVRLKLMNADGSHQTPVIQARFQNSGIAWSPDGTKVTFAQDGDIFTVNVDGSGLRNLTLSGGAVDTEPAWSPDGKTIAFASGQMAATGYGFAMNIYAINVDGGNIRQLIPNSGNFGFESNYLPKWSPDGKSLLFLKQMQDTPDFLFRYDLTTGRSTQIAICTIFHDWSSDGSKFLFWSYGSSLDPDGAIFISGSNGTPWVRVGTGYYPDWQPATVAAASLSGRVLTPDGRGLRNVVITATSSSGITRFATTSSFGYYTFADLPLGTTQTLSINSKRYRFTSRSFTLTGDLTDVEFTGLE